ncbi:MAG: acetyl-CoA C-acetyltransferase [Intrasporangiaceae bacterium]|nr:acetyl-CoA C-acetyltransferase [Intrasporangiaceae bacterium]
MSDTVICEPLRTAVGRYGGTLKGVSAADLGATVLRAVVERSGVDPDDIADVVVGHASPTSEAPAIGRVIALDAGLPQSVPGLQIDRRCGSGLQAVLYAALHVSSGAGRVVAAGGAESMSNAVYYSTDLRWGAQGRPTGMHDQLGRARVVAGGRNHPVEGGMIETAENLRRDYGISRQEQDELAVESHRRAVATQQAGIFAEEIVPVTVPGRRGDTVVDVDEHPRPGTDLESLSRLAPIMGAQDPDATVTAGNASGQNDAASMCLVTTRDYAEANGLRPLVRLVSWGLAGGTPERMGLGPVPATRIALEQAGLTLADMDLIELNEAFAAQVLAVTREWGFGEQDWQRTNVHGSGISLGHPIGATGTRILTTLSRELTRREGRYALETMCIGGGQGLAAVWERVE